MTSNYVNFVPRSPPPLGDDQAEVSSDDFGEFSSARDEENGCKSSNAHLPSPLSDSNHKDAFIKSDQKEPDLCWNGAVKSNVEDDTSACTSFLGGLQETGGAFSNFRLDNSVSPIDLGMVRETFNEPISEDKLDASEDLSFEKSQSVIQKYDCFGEYNSGYAADSDRLENEILEEVSDPGFVFNSEFLGEFPSIIQSESRSLKVQSCSEELEHDLSLTSEHELKLSDSEQKEEDDSDRSLSGKPGKKKEDDVEDLCFESFQEFQEEGDTDFDNFQFASYSGNTEDTALRDFGVPVPDSEFVADFSDFQASSAPPNEDDDDFNEFECANISADISEGIPSNLPSIDLSNSSKNISQLLYHCFPESVGNGDGNEVVSLECIMKYSQQCNPVINSDKCVWTSLYDLDKTHALMFHWNSSVANKKLLSALNVDARNIEYIPPAQFDWSSSGLTNPLDDASNSMLTLLDLEFFTTLEDGNTKPSDSAMIRLESEFLGANEKTVPEFNRPALLEQILTTAKMSATPSSLSSPVSHELSPEARNLLHLLPDLNFMQANVLMFPIQSSSPVD